jgi:hypothetical protein
MENETTYTIVTTDAQEARRLVKSLDMALAIWEIQTNLRKRCENRIAHTQRENPYDILDIVLEQIADVLADHHINAEDLVS